MRAGAEAAATRAVRCGVEERCAVRGRRGGSGGSRASGPRWGDAVRNRPAPRTARTRRGGAARPGRCGAESYRREGGVLLYGAVRDGLDPRTPRERARDGADLAGAGPGACSQVRIPRAVRTVCASRCASPWSSPAVPPDAVRVTGCHRPAVGGRVVFRPPPVEGALVWTLRSVWALSASYATSGAPAAALPQVGAGWPSRPGTLRPRQGDPRRRQGFSPYRVHGAFPYCSGTGGSPF